MAETTLPILIRTAFDRLQRTEQTITLHEADIIRTQGEASPRRAEARGLDNDRYWWQIADANFDRFNDVFRSLDESGLAYYLPAYFLWSLKTPYHTIKSKTLINLITELTVPEGWDVSEARKKRFAYFSAFQSHVIYLFLQHWVDNGNDTITPAAQTAIDKYWIRHQDFVITRTMLPLR